jgi:hypothetical protein|tara:strand:- start:329 stop:568 length:240 start_codon:yes stop_codon:yes gene_type:complete
MQMALLLKVYLILKMKKSTNLAVLAIMLKIKDLELSLRRIKMLERKEMMIPQLHLSKRSILPWMDEIVRTPVRPLIIIS